MIRYSSVLYWNGRLASDLSQTPFMLKDHQSNHLAGAVAGKTKGVSSLTPGLKVIQSVQSNSCTRCLSLSFSHTHTLFSPLLSLCWHRLGYFEVLIPVLFMFDRLTCFHDTWDKNKSIFYSVGVADILSAPLLFLFHPRAGKHPAHSEGPEHF